jgi:peptidoglycan/xylan/chitin deacetylase (PgdA/CDA1 family)
MKFYFAILFLTISISSFAQNHKVAITVDDLPTVPYGIEDLEFQKELTLQLIQTFVEFDIPAIGYVNESKLYDNGELDSDKVGLLELWLSNGYELGNHTFSHPNYHETPFDDFTADVLKGEKVTKPLSEKFNLPYRYFRHPYLRIGTSQSHADSLRNFLKQHGYTPAPVTIDNEDYIFAKAYHIAYSQNDPNLMSKIGESYVDYMEEKLKFYKKSSQTLFGRNISQTLLIHANLLNAHFLDDLAEMYVEHGYSFISQEEALQDEAYQTSVTRYGPWGISWIDRWAISRGVDRSFFDGDPITPDYIHDLSNSR